MEGTEPSPQKIKYKETTEQISENNEHLKKIYEEAYNDRYEYFIKEKGYDETSASSKARAIAANSAILECIENTRDYHAVEIDETKVKNFDVFIPETIVGCLRHPILIKQVYKTTHEKYGVKYSYAVEWLDEENSDVVQTDTWTPPIKCPQFGAKWSGDAIIPLELAVALKDCHADRYNMNLSEKNNELAEMYYLANPPHGLYRNSLPYARGNGKTYNHGDLIEGKEIGCNSVLKGCAYPALTYMDLFLWLLHAHHSAFNFIPRFHKEYGKFYAQPLDSLYISDDKYDTGFIPYDSYEECIIGYINEIFEAGGFHPFYTYYEKEYDEETAHKLVNDGFWNEETFEEIMGEPLKKASKELITKF